MMKPEHLDRAGQIVRAVSQIDDLLCGEPNCVTFQWYEAGGRRSYDEVVQQPLLGALCKLWRDDLHARRAKLSDEAAEIGLAIPPYTDPKSEGA